MIDPTQKTDIEIFNSIKSPPSYFRGGDRFILRYDITPIITKEDLDNGYVLRYFARSISNTDASQIIEIDSSKFSLYSTISLYKTLKLVWKIRGKLEDVYNSNGNIKLYTGIITANKKSIEDGDKVLSGLIQKLQNPAQFYQGE